MKLTDIIEKWENDGRLYDAARANDALDVINIEGYGQVVINIDNDTHISDDIKEGLLNTLISCTKCEFVYIQDHFEAYCRDGNEYIGPVNPVAKEVILGHVMLLSKFEKCIKGSRDPFSLIRTKSPIWIDTRWLLKQKWEIQRKIIAVIQLDDRKMWCFYDTNTEKQPFANVGLSSRELCRRLGLGHIDPARNDLICLSYKLPDYIQPYTPTTLDAGLYIYFLPGGYTKPLSGPLGDGFPEVIHIPITGEHISSELRLCC